MVAVVWYGEFVVERWRGQTQRRSSWLALRCWARGGGMRGNGNRGADNGWFAPRGVVAVGSVGDRDRRVSCLSAASCCCSLTKGTVTSPDFHDTTRDSLGSLAAHRKPSNQQPKPTSPRYAPLQWADKHFRSGQQTLYLSTCSHVRRNHSHSVNEDFLEVSFKTLASSAYAPHQATWPTPRTTRSSLVKCELP
jgi:hypothetical protein